MKNMRVAKKLIVSFLIVSVLTVIVGGVGVVGLTSMMRASAEVAKMVGRLRGLEPDETRHRMILERAS